jgi:hypothetical protein
MAARARVADDCRAGEAMTRPKLYEFMFRGIDARDGIWLYDNWDTLTPAERAGWGFTDEPEPAEPPSVRYEGNVVPFRPRNFVGPQ